MRADFAWVCVCCAAIWPAYQADAQSVEHSLSEALSLETDDACMSVEPLTTRVAHWLHAERIDSRISARVLDRDQQLSFEILFQAHLVSERTFDVLPHDCDARRDAVALALSLALENVVQRRDQIAAEVAASPPGGADPDAVDGVEMAPPDDQATEVAAATPTEPVDSQLPTHPDDDGPRFGLSLGAGASFHTLPATSALGELALELSDTWIGARLGFLASTAANATLLQGEVDVRMFGGRADACLRHPVGDVGLTGCAGVQVGAIRMVGHGFARSGTSSLPWIGVAARVAAEWPRDRVRGRVFLDAMIPTLAPAAGVAAPDGASLGKLTTVRSGVVLGVEAVVVFR